MIEHLDWKTGQCNPCFKTIANKVGISPGSVGHSVRRHAAEGWIDITCTPTRTAKGLRWFYSYKLLVERRYLSEEQKAGILAFRCPPIRKGGEVHDCITLSDLFPAEVLYDEEIEHVFEMKAGHQVVGAPTPEPEVAVEPDPEPIAPIHAKFGSNPSTSLSTHRYLSFPLTRPLELRDPEELRARRLARFKALSDKEWGEKVSAMLARAYAQPAKDADKKRMDEDTGQDHQRPSTIQPFTEIYA